MADTKPSAMTEDLTLDPTDVFWVQTADGLADKRVPGSVLATQSELDTVNTALDGRLDVVEPKVAHLTVTQAVDLDAIETRVNALDAAVVLVGVWDASAGTFPGGGTAQAGYSYIVSVAGTVDGVAFALNDRVIAIADNASTATFAANWFKADYTDQVLSVNTRTGAVTGLAEQTDLDTLEAEVDALPQMEAGVRTTVDTGNPGFLSTDVDLATGVSGGDTLTGGISASDGLTLASTSNATRGTINGRDQLVLITENKTWASPNTGVYFVIDVPSTTTITLDHTTAGANQFVALRCRPTIVYEVNSATVAQAAIINTPTLKNASGEARTINTSASMNDAPTFTADAATVTLNAHTGMATAPVLGVVSAGTLNATAVTGFQSGATVGASATVTTRTGFLVADTTGSGTVTTGIGVDIPTMTHAATSIGLRNASTEVNTPTTKAITVAGDTIPITARLIRLNNTSGGSVTLTSAPTMADGQNGQLITLLNTSANNVVIQDQGTLASSNMRLTATGVTIGPRQSVTLTYSTTVGDWVQTGALVAVI